MKEILVCLMFGIFISALISLIGYLGIRFYRKYIKKENVK